MNPDRDDLTATPREEAESEEQDAWRQAAAERGARGAAGDDDDPREEEGWTQPESSAQKGAIRDEG